MPNKQINFIPENMAVPAKSVKLAHFLNKISTFGVISIIIFVVLTIFIFIFSSVELKKTENSLKSLKNEIASLERSEQKLILVKDRLEKISYIKSLNSAEDDISNFKNLNESLSLASGSSFTQVDIGSSKTELSLVANNSDSLISALGLFYNLKEYQKIILTSLVFNLKSGYISSFLLEGK